MSLRESRCQSRLLKGQARHSRWYPLGKVLRPNGAVRPWLLEQGSLTLRLQRHYGPISVQVLRQQTDRMLNDEGSNVNQPGICRDVVLSATDHQPLVVAHSVLALRPRGILSLLLKRLGRQALGSVLFSRPGFVRYQREWALLDERQPLYRMVQRVVGPAIPSRLWARRAVFNPLRNPRQLVQVTEVFCISDSSS